MSLPDPPGILSGSITKPVPFGKYLILGMIARGGMAEVYRARLPEEEDRLLAIKCMRAHLVQEPRFVDMFIREGKLAMLLDHPSIVHCHEVGCVAGRYFIAMDYIGGKDLAQILRRCQETNRRIPVPHAIYIAAAICDGLDYAHRCCDQQGRPLGIVNRDVSPSNIRISYDGSVKLLDFGIAQALLEFTSEIGILKGKFSYMSPEQIRGMPLDARSDVFAVGILLHEMLTTEKLFRGDTDFALMETVRKANITPPSKFNRRVPPALDAMVLKALARDLPERYQSAGELGLALRELLASYRFNFEELRDFLHGMFRQDYVQECSEVATCMKASATASAAPAADEIPPATAPKRPSLWSRLGQVFAPRRS